VWGPVCPTGRPVYWHPCLRVLQHTFVKTEKTAAPVPDKFKTANARPSPVWDNSIKIDKEGSPRVSNKCIRSQKESPAPVSEVARAIKVRFVRSLHCRKLLTNPLKPTPAPTRAITTREPRKVNPRLVYNRTKNPTTLRLALPPVLVSHPDINPDHPPTFPGPIYDLGNLHFPQAVPRTASGLGGWLEVVERHGDMSDNGNTPDARRIDSFRFLCGERQVRLWFKEWREEVHGMGPNSSILEYPFPWTAVKAAFLKEFVIV
jgi:hypothetical protein